MCCFIHHFTAMTVFISLCLIALAPLALAESRLLLFNLLFFNSSFVGFNCNDDNPKPICLPENYSKFELPNTGGSDFDVDVDVDIDVDAQKTKNASGQKASQLK